MDPSVRSLGSVTGLQRRVQKPKNSKCAEIHPVLLVNSVSFKIQAYFYFRSLTYRLFSEEKTKRQCQASGIGPVVFPDLQLIQFSPNSLGLAHTYGDPEPRHHVCLSFSFQNHHFSVAISIITTYPHARRRQKVLSLTEQHTNFFFFCY